MATAIVIYQLPLGRTVAVSVPEWSVEAAKHNARRSNMPVIAVIRPKLYKRRVRTRYCVQPIDD